MIKFVVVDDDTKVCQDIKTIIRKVACTCSDPVKINCYNSVTKSLIADMNETGVQTVFILDIALPGGKSGIQLAKEIREKSLDSIIIFITNHDKMFESVYRNIYNIFDFVEKFHNFEKRIEEDIKLIVDKKFDEKCFTYSNRNLDLQIFLKSITYIARDKEERKIIINTDTNQYIISMNLADCLKELDERFKFSHRSCIVNTRRIQSYNWVKGYFVLDSGEKIELLSRKYKKELAAK